MLHFRDGNAKAAAAQFAAYIARNPKARDVLQARFLRAVALMRDSQYQAAGEIFRDLEKHYELLQPYVAFFAARCGLEARQPEMALSALGRIPKGTALDDDVLKLRGDALFALGRHEEARRSYDEYLRRYPSGSRANVVRKRLAETLEKIGAPVLESIALYRSLFIDAAGEEVAEEAHASLLRLAARLPQAERKAALTFSPEEMLRRATRFFDRMRNAEAERAVEEALKEPNLPSKIECEGLFLRAQIAFRKRPRSRAAPLFDAAVAACTKASDTDRRAKSLYQAARAYVSGNDPDRARALYDQLIKEHPAHTYADDAALRLAEVLEEQGKPEEAASLLASLPTKFPSGDMKGEALFRLTFRAWRNGNMDAAVRYATEYGRLPPREALWYAEGGAQYYMARALERKGERSGALAAYEHVIRNYPLSYYALLSFLRMEALSPARAQQLKKELYDPSRPPSWRFSPRPLYAQPAFQRGVELARLGLFPEARAELARAGVSAPAKKHASRKEAEEAEELGWVLALLLDRAGNWASSHSLVKHHLTSFWREYPRGAHRLKWELAYPRAYPTIFPSAAQEGEIPVTLLYAIAREESAFNRGAVSPAQALGLTQLLLKTAKRFAPAGVAVTQEKLFDPALNVRIGAKYLGWLLGHFGGSVALTVAGYNAGEAAVGRWLKERGSWPLDDFIEAIPYDETRGYTKRVLASYFVYSWLENGTIPSLALGAAAPQRGADKRSTRLSTPPRAGKTTRR